MTSLFVRREEKRNKLVDDIRALKKRNPESEINLTLTEAAIFLYCSEQTIRRKIWNKELVPIKAGKIMVTYESVLAYYESTTEKAIAGCRDQKR